MILLVCMNPSHESFKDYQFFKLGSGKGIDSDLIKEKLVSTRTSNFFILSIYEYTYTGPQKKETKRRSYDQHTISTSGEYIGILGNFFKVYEQ